MQKYLMLENYYAMQGKQVKYITTKHSLHEQLATGRQRDVTASAQKLQAAGIFRRERHHLLGGTPQFLLQSHHGGGLGPLDDPQQTFDGRHRQGHGGPMFRRGSRRCATATAAMSFGTRPRQVLTKVLQDGRVVDHGGVGAHTAPLCLPLPSEHPLVLLRKMNMES